MEWQRPWLDGNLSRFQLLKNAESAKNLVGMAKAVTIWPRGLDTHAWEARRG